ncbi:hypothetical protein [Nitrosomonas sp.]|uniref:hypothetical protein n=1 Tax=Nitrosomonas sp. TaxID=42353 RepID=UPI00374D67C6
MANEYSTPTTGSRSSNPPEWGDPEWGIMNDADFADNIMEKIKGEKAILTPEEMDIIERFWEKDRATRRSALIALIKPYSWLEENIKNDTAFAEAMVAVYECIDPDKYRQIANLLFDAQRRVMCAMACREDMRELMIKAKAESEATE